MAGSRRAALWLPGLGALACVLAWALWLRGGAVGTAASASAAAPLAAVPAPAPTQQAAPGPAPTIAAATAPARAAAAAPDQVPAGLSAEQWQQMNAALADHPQREAELRRITAFLQLQARVQAFADARQRGASRAELAALALPLQAALPQHLAQGEVNAAEALRLQAALLAVTEPDSAAAGQALADWRTRYLGAAANTAPDPREAAFAQAQREVVAKWQATGGQDAQALEQELENLRKEHFDARR